VIEIGSGGALRSAVVFIENIDRGKAPDLARVPQIDNRGCQFVPRVQALTVGQTLEIVNSDPILHNTHAYDGNRTVFNLALPVQGQRIPKKITAAGVLAVQCDAGHEWMKAWVHAFPHPYHAVTGADGRVVLDDVPAGLFRVTAWHEELGSQTMEVEVVAGGTAEITFDRLVPRAATSSSS
jgi:hypothetical protein